MGQRHEVERLDSVNPGDRSQEQTAELSLSQLCDYLSISYATGKNWLRQGRLEAKARQDGTPFFTKEYATSLHSLLSQKDNPALKSRRNKSRISGHGMYRDYLERNSANGGMVQELLKEIDSREIRLSEEEITYLLAECALRLFEDKENGLPEETPRLPRFLGGELELGRFSPLVRELLADEEEAAVFVEKYPALFTYPFEYQPGEDVLGFLYLSCKNRGNRKADGQYYTPVQVVKKLIHHLISDNPYEKTGNASTDKQGEHDLFLGQKEKEWCGKRYLDPACGTGNFLLQLPFDIPLSRIFGSDIDPVSVRLTRLNLALRYRPEDISVLYRNIVCRDYLTGNPEERKDSAKQYDSVERCDAGKCWKREDKFDVILGNPPWGCDFSRQEKKELRKRYRVAEGEHIESCDMFVERALHQLEPGGELAFVLPEAILNVRSHNAVRRLILEQCSISFLSYLGECFSGVQCPSVILQLIHTGERLRCVGMCVEEGERTYFLKRERSVSEASFSFRTTDEEQAVLDAIESSPDSVHLRGKADFALGIVTGDNKRYVKEYDKQMENKEDGIVEPVLRGKDINRFHIQRGERYIDFCPEQFQQMAPVGYYRAPEKLLYRFICRQLVFAYDDSQTLSLNSCNVLIPKIEGMSVRYVMAVLNSRVAQFFYQKKFSSVKVLRSYLEEIPIPVATKEEQRELEQLAQELGRTRNRQLYDCLDEKISKLYKLSCGQYALICDALKDMELYL